MKGRNDEQGEGYFSVRKAPKDVKGKKQTESALLRSGRYFRCVTNKRILRLGRKKADCILLGWSTREKRIDFTLRLERFNTSKNVMLTLQ